MASLDGAWSIINDAEYAPFRRRLEVAVWSVARTKRASGAPLNGPESDLCTRVLRGDESPHRLALWSCAVDQGAQDVVIAGKADDSALLGWVNQAWPSIAGIS